MEFRKWDQLTVVEQLQSEFSDFYKDVHGFRPRFASAEQWNSQEWLEAQVASLVVESKVVFAAEEEAEKAAVAAFEVRVQATIEAGAADRETAIKWLFDAEQDEYVLNDPDYYCHLYGLPYGFFKKAA